MEIKKLDHTHLNEFIELIRIFKTVFENDTAIPERQYLEKLLLNPDFLVIAALKDGKVVGGLTIYVLHQYHHQKPLAYIYDVGVSPGHQGRGIGKALIAYACGYCKENGFDSAYVEAEMDDADAVRFYRRTHFSGEMNAIHFTYSFEDRQ